MERRAETLMLCGVIQRSAGAKVEVPDPDKLRADFDAWLFAEPKISRQDPERKMLMLALGLGG